MWTRQQGISSDTERHTCTLAAWAGQLATLQWMRKHGWAWDWRVCTYAALGGRLAVLQWARQHNCAWDWQVCANAATGGPLLTCNGRTSKVAPGTAKLAQRQPSRATWQSCSGPMSTAAHVMKAQPRQLRKGFADSQTPPPPKETLDFVLMGTQEWLSKPCDNGGLCLLHCRRNDNFLPGPALSSSFASPS